MIVAVSSTGPSVDDELDMRFGRCQYFLFVETDTMKAEAVPNQTKDLSGGAGTKAAQTVMDKGVKAVLTGNIGPNAYNALSAGGVLVYTGFSGSVLSAVESFKAGNASETVSPTVEDRFGTRGKETESPMRTVTDVDMGRKPGRGTGKGCGRRGGRGGR